METILETVKNLLSVSSDEDAFDSQLIPLINSALFSLMQLGIGPSEGFMVHDGTETWHDLLGGCTDLYSVQEYVGLKVRLVFDPPDHGFVLTAMQDMIKEFEWRLREQGGLRVLSE